MSDSQAKKPADRAAEAKLSGAPSGLKKPKRPTIVRPFPIYPLERALSIAMAIKEKNAGNPWPPSQVSRAIGIGEKSSYLDIMARSSQMYGLTSGTRQAISISLEKIGREIVYAPNAEAQLLARRRAFLNVDLFAKVLEYYKGSNLPEPQYLSNTLYAEFQLDRTLHEEFRKVFLENCTFCGIQGDFTGTADTLLVVSQRPQNEPMPAIKAFASSENRDGKRCFVIMPFSERLGLVGISALPGKWPFESKFLLGGVFHYGKALFSMILQPPLHRGEQVERFVARDCTCRPGGEHEGDANGLITFGIGGSRRHHTCHVATCNLVFCGASDNFFDFWSGEHV